MNSTRTIKILLPSEEHGRHSEGDFIRLKDNRILFAYSRYTTGGGKDSSPCAIAVMYSEDEGETWSDAVDIVHPDQYGCANVMSVSLLRFQNGDLGLEFGITGNGWTPRHVILRSSDEGQTFYEENDIFAEGYDGRFGLNNSRIVRLASGRLIVPYSIHPGAKKEAREGYPRPRISKFTFGHVVYSDDDGRTWKSSNDIICPPFTDTSKGLQEGGIIEIAPGILRSYWRSDVGHQYMSMSFDNGEHWTAPQRSRFTGPWSAMHMVRNPFNEKIYAIWNPIPLYNGRKFDNYNWGRSPYVLAEVSPDGNIPNDKLQVIENDPSHGYCYPAVLFTKENEMLMAYCCGGELTNRNCLAALKIAKVTIEQ